MMKFHVHVYIDDNTKKAVTVVMEGMVRYGTVLDVAFLFGSARGWR